MRGSRGGGGESCGVSSLPLDVSINKKPGKQRNGENGSWKGFRFPRSIHVTQPLRRIYLFRGNRNSHDSLVPPRSHGHRKEPKVKFKHPHRSFWDPYRALLFSSSFSSSSLNLSLSWRSFFFFFCFPINRFDLRRIRYIVIIFCDL